MPNADLVRTMGLPKVLYMLVYVRTAHYMYSSTRAEEDRNMFCNKMQHCTCIVQYVYCMWYIVGVCLVVCKEVLYTE